MKNIADHIADYIKDRDAAMLSYPDTQKLGELVKNYPYLFSPQFKAIWRKAKEYTKVRTLELMIKDWAGAPEWLKTKVEEAERERSQTNDR